MKTRWCKVKDDNGFQFLEYLMLKTSCHSSRSNASEQMSLREATHPVWGEDPRSKNQQLPDQGLPLTLIGCGGSNKNINFSGSQLPRKT